ncbi:MAG: hypothetical protein A3B99_03790 [Candidatus Yanofskybacteria bacterium RIFCSPHIGHO2_02_FULL_44_12b]|uniref:Uncharacterized protein n=2 Tax=Candidatus Yanofskyibacteriota TaxID=1752733 RepID=A0A1F8GMQ6_9BACT|nr:MAG: hypothetical protein UW79_C0032G0007 [Candidatus Yanofskybacteria bacterium GW2011_GWA2_44_9]OGN15642.1 MAG: hypothetical protein A3B99_03790 [Candidatus Yanofskybacteria bacterium RIFCSPHIGHO2_02_FULL_44_12b]OGN26697.1 MAG: hypothetical protein A2925_03875 [Candidatus Yanofskybacteria bacterium RIFCSPLOWO2_01_FULL_44_22]
MVLLHNKLFTTILSSARNTKSGETPLNYKNNLPIPHPNMNPPETLSRVPRDLFLTLGRQPAIATVNPPTISRYSIAPSARKNFPKAFK